MMMETGKIQINSLDMGGKCMKAYLIIIQFIYILSLFPWFVIWGMSFMSFDAGFSFQNITFVLIITLYPIAILVCSIIAWLFQKKRVKLAVILNLVPMLWVISFAVFMFWVG